MFPGNVGERYVREISRGEREGREGRGTRGCVWARGALQTQPTIFLSRSHPSLSSLSSLPSLSSHLSRCLLHLSRCVGDVCCAYCVRLQWCVMLQRWLCRWGFRRTRSHVYLAFISLSSLSSLLSFSLLSSPACLSIISQDQSVY